MAENKRREAVVTPDDFRNTFGQDLASLLSGASRDGNYPAAFLLLVQDFLLDWCDYSGFRRTKDLSDMTEQQLSAFKKAVLYQAYYAWKNGSVALGLDSGYDAEKGTVVPEEALRKAAVPERVVMLLHSSGLFNLTVKNRPRRTRGYPWIGPMGSYD